MFRWLWREPERVAHEAPQPVACAYVAPVEEPYDPRPPVLKAFDTVKASNKRHLHAHQVAEQVLAWLRDEGYCAYPYLSKDLDDQIRYWCESNVVEMADCQVVREVIAAAPGVTHLRRRLNRNDPRDKFLIQRLESRGKREPRNGWRMWLYVIQQEVPVEARHVPDDFRVVPAKSRPKRTSLPAYGREAPPRRRDAPEPAWDLDGDDFVIGEEMPRRRSA